MKLKTFYKLFYRHRVVKANIFLKIYIILIIPFRYIANFLFFKKKINLDEYSKKKADLYQKDLNYLFEYFNSDKGNKFYDQYVQPIKKNSKIKIDGHGYSKFYEDYFNEEGDDLNKFKMKQHFTSSLLFFLIVFRTHLWK